MRPDANMLAGTRREGGTLDPMEEDMNEPTCRSRDMLCMYVCVCVCVCIYIYIYIYIYIHA